MYKSEVIGKGGIYAKVVADSLSKGGNRLTTLELNYHRYIHGEFMTHRLFSRNASSSRAIPVKTMLKNISESPATPIHWGKNQAGMQAREECSNLVMVDYSRGDWWEYGCEESIRNAHYFDKAGYHKQIVNRVTEPYQFIKVVVSATEWENFFHLRLHKDAQPEIQELARCIKQAMDESEPTSLVVGCYHTPYVERSEGFLGNDGCSYWDMAIKCSVARCARVSYLNHDNSTPNIEKDISLYGLLLSSKHMSPFEHVAKSMNYSKFAQPLGIVDWDNGTTHMDKQGVMWSGNFKGFVQHRQEL